MVKLATIIINIHTDSGLHGCVVIKIRCELYL